MSRAILTLILICGFNPLCRAEQPEDYSLKAEAYHSQSDADTLYPILELKALYYQNKQIIAELKAINSTLKELQQAGKLGQSQNQLLEQLFMELKASDPRQQSQH